MECAIMTKIPLLETLVLAHAIDYQNQTDKAACAVTFHWWHRTPFIPAATTRSQRHGVDLNKGRPKPRVSMMVIIGIQRLASHTPEIYTRVTKSVKIGLETYANARIVTLASRK